MGKINLDAFKKHLGLTAVGVTLQVAGSLLLAVASLGVLKEINAQIKKRLVQELSK